MGAFHRLLSGTMLRLTYGHIVQSDDDDYMLRIGRAAHLLALYPNPGAMPVDFFPFCESAFQTKSFIFNSSLLISCRDDLSALPAGVVPRSRFYPTRKLHKRFCC